MLAKAVELADEHGWFLCRQFENEANADVHSRTTAQEILADFAGERLDYLVIGLRHRRHAEGRGARAEAGEPGDARSIAAEPDNCAGARQRHPAAARRRRQADARAIRASART